MIARNHWKVGLAAGLGAGTAAVALELVTPATAAGLAAAACCASLGSDLDKPPEGDIPGSTAAEAHGVASNLLAELVAATHRGHRGLTHRYWYAAAVGLAVAALSAEPPAGWPLAAWWGWPTLTALALFSWWGAWPLYCTLGRLTRWASAILAPVAALIAWRLEVLPATPWLGAAVALGWASHIAADDLQSALGRTRRLLPGRWLRRRAEAVVGIGGWVERAIAWGALAAAALVFRGVA